MTRFYNALAATLQAHNNCAAAMPPNREWLYEHKEIIEMLVKDYAPKGSGFDAGTTFDFDASKPDRLVFNTAFHHMNDDGMYVGWTHHTVIVKQSLTGYDIRVTGRDRNSIKVYINVTFHELASLEML